MVLSFLTTQGGSYLFIAAWVACVSFDPGPMGLFKPYQAASKEVLGTLGPWVGGEDVVDGWGTERRELLGCGNPRAMQAGAPSELGHAPTSSCDRPLR